MTLTNHSQTGTKQMTEHKHWAQLLELRDEIANAGGRMDDLQASLPDAYFGRDDRQGPTLYSDPEYYGEITHPTKGLVRFMAQVAVRLALDGHAGNANWHLDQAMGGGKSHCLIGLWHLAKHPRQLANSDIGKQIWQEAEQIHGSPLPDNLGDPICVILDCDNPAFDSRRDGPATNLGERFLWRLVEGETALYESYKTRMSNKAGIAAVVNAVNRPILILMDELLNFLAWAVQDDHQLAASMSFLRALFDAVNDIPNCVLVTVLINTDDKKIASTAAFNSCRAEVEGEIVRNTEKVVVSGGGDFTDIILRRLFKGDIHNHRHAAQETVKAMTSTIQTWRSISDRADKMLSDGIKTWPFQPELMEIVENKWATHASFQKVRSTLQIFAYAVHRLMKDFAAGNTVPAMIGTGDIPLGDRSTREALLNSGLIESQTAASWREIITSSISDPDHLGRSVAEKVDAGMPDNTRERWKNCSPPPAVRATNALMIYTLTPLGAGINGATDNDILASMLTSAWGDFTESDANDVWKTLLNATTGLAAVERVTFTGGRPARHKFTTRLTLEMIFRAERDAVQDKERDKLVTDVAASIATSVPKSPFKVVPMSVHHEDDHNKDKRWDWNDEGDELEYVPHTTGQLTSLLSKGNQWDKPAARLVVLDSRCFTHGNGESDESDDALRYAAGELQGPPELAYESSAVYSVIDAHQRSSARGVARNVLAAERAADRVKAAVGARDSQYEEAVTKHTEAKQALEERVRAAYKHVAYAHELPSGQRVLNWADLGADHHRTALDGKAVWQELANRGKCFLPSGSTELVFTGLALTNVLRDSDYDVPLNELHGRFYKLCRLPLLPNPTEDLRRGIYEACKNDDIEMVHDDDTVIQPRYPADVEPTNKSIRLRKKLELAPTPPDVDDTDTGPLLPPLGGGYSAGSVIPEPPENGSSGVESSQTPPQTTRITFSNITIDASNSRDITNILRAIADILAEQTTDDETKLHGQFAVTADSERTDKLRSMINTLAAGHPGVILS